MNDPNSKRNLCHNVDGDDAPDFHQAEKVKPFSGFIIIRLMDRFSYLKQDDLKLIAKEFKLSKLISLLEKNPPALIRRNISCVSMDKLRELEEKAQHSRFRPLHSLSNYWRLDYRQYDGNVDDLVKLFSELYEVDLAYKEMSVSDPVINAANDTFASQQNYLDAAPTGIDARWAWTQTNGEGAGVGFIDLEQGWIPTHEDLAGASPTLVFNDNRDGVGSYVGDHGTAVLGQVMGVDNARGIIGIAPSLSYVRMVSHYEASSGTALHVADAIVAAILNMDAGDVLLLEVQRGSPPWPTETDNADFDAIRLAVAHGIIIVEAAGNGNNNLDTWVNGGGLTILNRGSVNFTDSGAIMVGASLSALPHNRAGFSNFGSRNDCYAWGENIVTSGYANRNTGSLGDDTTATLDDDYTSDFGGTSGASPMIVGAALIIQGMYKAATTSVLSPLQMRSLLSNPATGTAQGGGVAGNIGVMPNLRAIIEDTLGLVPDIYMRDYVGDNGIVPSTGAISSSPDIIVRPASVANPVADFGEGSGNENSNTLGYTVESGQDNFIYVRMKNRGGSDANNAIASIWWSEVSTLVTPNLWHFIGNTAPVNVPVGDTLVVTNPLTWPSAALPPANTHQCFVGVLQHAQDPAPPIPSAVNFDWDDFRAFIRNHNNVTWRNFNVVNDVDPADPSAMLPFNITGTPDKARRFDLEILIALPAKAQVWIEMPYILFQMIKINGIKTKFDKGKKYASVLFPDLRRLQICNVHLPKEAKFKCRFIVKGGRGYEKGMYHLAIRQLFEGFEVGRVTWALKAKEKVGKKK